MACHTPDDECSTLLEAGETEAGFCVGRVAASSSRTTWRMVLSRLSNTAGGSPASTCPVPADVLRTCPDPSPSIVVARWWDNETKV